MDRREVYVVVGCTPWAETAFCKRISRFPGEWHYIDDKDDLNIDALSAIEPVAVFFLHWSWKVQDDLLDAYECICFHMTDLPYGRGGSPLQNLILRGHTMTRLTAFRMTAEFDAGPVYLKRNMSLDGSAREIYDRMCDLASSMILDLIPNLPDPKPQEGKPVVFSRRKPDQSWMTKVESLSNMHDFIRMHDAAGYPKAFLVHEGLRFEFSDSHREGGRLTAQVEISMLDSES
jgi:methionyl-tRNA formyltransferase